MILFRMKWVLVFYFFIFGCRGTSMKTTPIHIIQNMDDVGRLEPQSQNFASYLIEDSIVFINNHKMSMLAPVEGTVSRNNDDFVADDNFIRIKNEIETGISRKGIYLEKIPKKFNINQEFLDRGEERFNIYCSVCHGSTGDGKGIVTNDIFSWHKNLMPANYHNPDDVDMDNWNKDGYIYSVITNGVGNMNGYAHQISVDDRWKIVSYVRSLNYAYREKIISDLKGFNSIKEQLLSNQFEELVSIDKYDSENLVQEFFKKDLIVEVQKIIKVDSPIPDGIWGEGSKRKWVKWKKDQLGQ